MNQHEQVSLCITGGPCILNEVLGYSLLYLQQELLGSNRETPLKGTLLDPTAGSLKVLRLSMSPRVALFLRGSIGNYSGFSIWKFRK